MALHYTTPKGTGEEDYERRTAIEQTLEQMTTEERMRATSVIGALPRAMEVVSHSDVQAVLESISSPATAASSSSSSPQTAAIREIAKRLEANGMMRAARRLQPLESKKPPNKRTSAEVKHKKSRSHHPPSTGKSASRAKPSHRRRSEDYEDGDGRRDDESDKSDADVDTRRKRRHRANVSHASSEEGQDEDEEENSNGGDEGDAFPSDDSGNEDDDEEWTGDEAPRRRGQQPPKRRLFYDEAADEAEAAAAARKSATSANKVKARSNTRARKPVAPPIRRPPPPPPKRRPRTEEEETDDDHASDYDDDAAETHAGPSKKRTPKPPRGCCGCATGGSLLIVLLILLLLFIGGAVIIFGLSALTCKIGGETSSVCFGWSSPESPLYGRSIYMAPIDSMGSIGSSVWGVVTSFRWFSSSSSSLPSTLSPSPIISAADGTASSTGRYLDGMLRSRIDSMVTAYKVPAVWDNIKRRSAANAQCLRTLHDSNHDLNVLFQVIVRHRVCDFVDEKSLAENVAVFFGQLDPDRAAYFVRLISQYPMKQ